MPGHIGRQAGLSLFILVLAAILAVVFERIGVAPSLLVAFTLILVLALGAASGALAGTMRLPVYLTGGGDLPVAAVGLTVATIVAAEGRLQPVPAMAAVAIWALLVAPVLRRTGMPGLAGALGHVFRNGALRVILALLAGTAALLFAAARLDAASAIVGPLLSLRPAAGTALVALALAIVLVPGGLRGATRMAIGLGLVSVLAGVAVVAVNVAGGGLTLARIADAAAPRNGDGLMQAFAMAALIAAPHLALVAPAGQSETAVREGGLWGALSAMALTTASLVVPDTSRAPSGIAVLLPMAQAGARLAVDLAAAGLLLHAASAALGYELRGHVDRRRNPMSRRFATLRLASLAVVIAAAWLSVAATPQVTAAQAPVAALLVGCAGPVLALAALFRTPGRWGGLLAALAGLVTAGGLMDGGVTAAWVPEAAAFGGLLAGFLVGLLPCLLARRQPAVAPVEAGAL